MLILAFDTTSEHGGAAIFRDQDCLAKVRNDRPASYSITLFEMVDGLLARCGVALRDIELFAVANGPGSFTGIRVGLAAAQAWARALERPARGVTVFEAMVEEVRPESAWAVPLLDARRGEFYLEKFRRTEAPSGYRFQAGGEGQTLGPSAIRSSLEELLRSGDTVTCLVREPDLAVQSLRASLPGALRWEVVETPPLAGIARAAIAAFEKEPTLPTGGLDAYYIRRPDAELLWRG